MRCENCNAEVPKLSECSDGRKVCCIHCLFNPFGCRCAYGEFGVEQTQLSYALEYPEDCVLEDD
jgi:hypothetical protein